MTISDLINELESLLSRGVERQTMVEIIAHDEHGHYPILSPLLYVGVVETPARRVFLQGEYCSENR